ncbi:hypothetical protein ATCC90586_010671 [Pythium insidiosum]|nr:hypothetical protein ATCC90586_010671 [Pythium insidiosum]
MRAEKRDLGERVSYISSANPNKDGDYNAIKTPDIEGGALRPGGAPKIWSRECFGLLAQYCAIGLVYGTLPGTVYPFLTVYLNMEGTQTTSADVLLTMPWSFKFLFGIITDCFPIMGFRRRPYMVIGWVMCLTCLVTLASMDPGPSYWKKPEYMRLKAEKITPDMVNESAKDQGGKFIILMMFAAFGYIQAAVASDAVVCEFAQREPEAVRGTTQTAIYTARTIFVIMSKVLSGFFFNGKEYGGKFDFTLSFQQLMMVLAIAVVPIIPITCT